VVQEYRMTYRVFDDKFENSTTLVIQVLDVNDNPPRFDNAVYNVLDLYEEEPGISKSSPKYLLTVCTPLLCIIMPPPLGAFWNSAIRPSACPMAQLPRL